VVRVHPKDIGGVKVTLPHYPASGDEIKAVLRGHGMSEENIERFIQENPATKGKFYKLLKRYLAQPD
jgi:hypothetical protein